MTVTLCLFHDHASGREPDWVSELSTCCRLVEVHRRDWVRLGRFVDLPWLVDVRSIDGEAAALLRPFFVFAGSAPRLVAVDRGDRQASVQASALGASQVVRRPIDAVSVLGLIGSFGPREEGATAPEGTSTMPIEGCPPRRTSTMDRVGLRDVTAVITAIDGAATALDRLFRALLGGRPIVRDDWEGIASDVVTILGGQHLEVLLDVVRRHHPGTYQHSLLVMVIAVGLGRSLGLLASDVEKVALGGLLHDVGKFRVPEAILRKPGRLTEAEFEVMRRHPRDGWAALQSVEPPLDPSVLDMVLHHQERLDGSGYPDGLAGTEITPRTRMVAVADVYGALLERRSYRPPLPPQQALAIVEAMAEEGHLDRDLVRTLADLGVGSIIGPHAGSGAPEPLDAAGRKEARR